MTATRMDELVVKTLTVSTEMSLPSGSVNNDDVAAAADFDTTKMKHRHSVSYSQNDGAVVASETKMVHLAYLPGTILDVSVRVGTAPTDTMQYTVDVQKASDGGSFATVLSSVVTVNSSSTANAKISATIDGNEEALVAGDAVRVVITPSGASGTQGTEVLVDIVIEEDGQ